MTKTTKKDSKDSKDPRKGFRTEDKENLEQGEVVTIRKQIGIHVDVQLWRKFRSRALEQGVPAGELVEQLISDYLGVSEQGKGKVFQRKKN